MSVTEFMDVDHNCETMNDLSDADIIKSVRTDEKSETEADEDEDDIPEEPMPTAKEVRTGLHSKKLMWNFTVFFPAARLLTKSRNFYGGTIIQIKTGLYRTNNYGVIL